MKRGGGPRPSRPPSPMARLTMKSLRWLAVVLAAAVVPAAGCSSIMDPGPATTAALHCTDPHGLELIIGAHRNAPRPSLDPTLVCQITAAIRAGEPVQIVAVSGQPRLISPRLEPVTGGTLAQQNSPRVQQD